MKNITRETVRDFARALIILNEQTTTLEVKNTLRARGYWATQDEVRNLMLDITSADSDIQYIDNGIHRIYRLANQNIQPNSQVSGLDQSANYDSTNKHNYDHRGICSLCGRSAGAIAHFGWTVCQPSTVTTAASNNTLQIAWATTPHNLDRDWDTQPVANYNPLHRDDRPATYLVTDILGRNRYRFKNVTRSEAKQKWATMTGRRFTEARTRKES
jgi:hypothetical protein